MDESRDERSVRSFSSFTDQLQAMVAWLKSCEVDVVAMEATGVYWIPVFEGLDREDFEVRLVDARATRQVSGRKSDVLDCQWIRPSDEICVLRAACASASASVRHRTGRVA